jgi:MFS family permease
MNPDTTAQSTSRWGPFTHPVFASIWTATVVSNIGGWMYSAASGWLMTSLNATPRVVALVQVATTLPMFLLALPAGALADTVDRRRYLLFLETFILLVSTAFAVLVSRDLITPVLLLLFVFLVEAGSAATSPAWQSVVPQLVPRKDLPSAIALNSVGVNVSRAVGPALGGAITASFGIAAPFWANAFSNVGVIGALFRWRSRPSPSKLPAERFFGAIRTGLRYARHNSQLRATMLRAVAFYLFASCYWALLPLVSRGQLKGGATLYGLLLGAIGASAVIGALALPYLRPKLGPDRLAAAGTIGTAVALILFGFARAPIVAFAACLLAGSCWIAVLATMNVSAQMALPNWVRGRGLASYSTVVFGALTIGSAVWGEVASWFGLPLAHYLAAAGALLFIPITWRWKLHAGAGSDLSPSSHWAPPTVVEPVAHDAGPVLVTVEYHIAPSSRAQFLNAMHLLSSERKRDGAYRWGIFEDVAEAGRFVETFLLDSWLEHLHQHERVTNADRVLQERIRHLLAREPVVTHMVAARSDSETLPPDA